MHQHVLKIIDASTGQQIHVPIPPGYSGIVGVKFEDGLLVAVASNDPTMLIIQFHDGEFQAMGTTSSPRRGIPDA